VGIVVKFPEEQQQQLWSSVGSKPSGKPCPRLMAPRSTESRDIASKIDVPASPNIGLTIGAPLSQSNLWGER
jgi:hypothetical protein